MEAVFYVNGALVPREEAKVSLFDHGLLYGDGVFEGMRMIDRRIFRLEDHMRRLASGLAAVGLTLPGGVEAALTAARAYRGRDAYLRLVVTRG